MLYETSLSKNDDALSLDEWIDRVEENEALDVSQKDVDPTGEYVFIMCSDYVLMFDKAHYNLLLL